MPLLDIFLILFLIFVLMLVATAFIGILTRTPFVPTKNKIIKRLLEIANIKKNQTLYDLGCGDGRLLFEAENKYKCVGEGFEIAPLAYLIAQIKKILNRSKTKIHFKNFFKTDLSKANVILCYLTPPILEKLGKKIKQECSSNTRIISHTFHIEGLKPIKTYPKDKKNGLPVIYEYKI